ncbi:MAG: histidinol-phosphatase [Lachnospiraceae bacterium]|nr:histidinol-phosphatase [Lachnospiraceae bacterium]
MFANYHTHTTRCLHAVGEDKEYVEAAIKAGIKVLGFSDHCPWVYPDDYVSGFRMTAQETEDYVDSLLRLRKEYESDIRILIGFEAEYISDLVDAQDELFAQYPVDYLILGQHFLGHEQDSVYTGAPTTDLACLTRYVDTVIEGMKTGRYLYLAHPDVINYKGDETLYRQEMTRLCEFLKEADSPVEINMLGAVEGRNYPNDTFLEIAREVGLKAIIGVDAHAPEQLTNPEGERLCEKLAEGMELLKEMPI